jgi:hypothetical protein
MHGANLLLLVLPLLTLATMTGTLAQVGLGVVVVVMYLAGSSYITHLVPSSGFSDAGDTFGYLAFLAVCLAVIFIQYARRSWGRSAAVLGALAVTTLLLGVGWPYGSAIAREYPSATADQTPLTLSLKPAVKESESYQQSTGDSKEVLVQISFYVAGIDDYAIIGVKGWRLALEFPDGSKWDSGWQGAADLMFSDRNEPTANFVLKRKLFERWGSSPITARVSMAYEKYVDRDRWDFVVPPDVFTLDGRDRCLAHQFVGVECFAPFHGPSFLVIRSEMVKSTCKLSEDSMPEGWKRPEPGLIARGYQRESADRFQPGISPVARYRIQLSQWKQTNIVLYPTEICTGTPIVLSNPQFKYKARVEKELRGLRLSDYVSRSMVGGELRVMQH